MPTGFDSDDVFENESSTRPKKSSGLSFVSVGDLLVEPDEKTNWLVRDLIPTSGVVLCSGRPKSMKSHWGRQCCVAISKGIPFLERQTIQGPTVYIGAEEKRGEVRKHFELLGADGSEPIYIHTGPVQRESLGRIADFAAKVDAKLLCLDTLVRATGIHFKDLCDYVETTVALEPLLELARSGISILLIHHTTKARFFDVHDSPLGSTSLTAVCDGLITLSRLNDSIVMSTRQRYAADSPDVYLNLDTSSRTLVLGLEKEQVDEARVAEAILKTLFSSPNPLSESEIESSVSGCTDVKRKALRTMVSDGSVQRHGKGAKGSPYLYAAKFSSKPLLP